MKTAHQITACLLISVILGSSLFYLTTPKALTDNDEDKSGYYVTLEIYQYRDGELIDKHIIEDDFILRNYAYMFINILSGERYADANNNYKVIDIDNVEHSFTNQIYFGYMHSHPAKIRLGTGTNPVAVTNYKLQTEVLNQVVDDGSIWVNGNQFNVTADSTMVSDGSYIITECGLSVGFGVSGGADSFLICRDVFSGITINNADVIVVRYIFRFNMWGKQNENK